MDALFGANTCNTNGGQAGYGFNPNGSLFCTGVAGTPRDVVGFNGPDSWIATAFYPDFFSYNFEPDNILVLPMERWSLYSNTTLDLHDNFKPYAQAMYTNYNALQELAPTPAAGTTGFTVPVTNPFLPQAWKNLAATRANPAAPLTFSKRFNDLGGRTSYNEHDVWQVVAGAKGDITGTTFGGSSLSFPVPTVPTVYLFVAHWCPHCRAFKAWLADSTVQGQIAGLRGVLVFGDESAQGGGTCSRLDDIVVTARVRW